MKASILGVVLSGVALAQPVVPKELADHCDFAGAGRILDSLPPTRRAERDTQLFSARVRVQLKLGGEAAELAGHWTGVGSPSERAEALLILGFAENLLNHFETALAHLREARRQGADSEIVDGAIGEVLVRARRNREAEVTLRDVLRRAPDLCGALYNLAVVRLREGNVAESAALIRQAWFAGFRNRSELSADPDLEPLRSHKGLIDDLLASTDVSCLYY